MHACDSQVYVGIMPNETWVDASTKPEACLAYICGWMSANMLMLNQEKIALIVREKTVHVA